MVRTLLLLLAAASLLPAQLAIFPLKQIHAGMTGTGRTVFSGARIEDFQVEILGVLDGIGPKQSLILARLSGGPLDKTGVMQGMSGSPVYIQGRLAGAVAMAFPFAKEPIAGIRPIEDMLAVERAPASPAKPAPARAAVTPWDTDLTRLATAERGSVPLDGDARLVDIATPISFGGFTQRTIEAFSPQLRNLGLEPRQALSGGRAPAAAQAARPLEPGSMISVQLLTGDYTVGADGTLTCIDGQTVYAFGHRFLGLGDTELPFTRAEVITLLANLNTSFKISMSKEWHGSITQDRTSAVTGHLGRRARMAPVTIRLNGNGANQYRMQVVNDRYLAPILVQMAVFSAIDATERAAGASTFTIRTRLDFEDQLPAVTMANVYTGDTMVPQIAALGIASPLSYALNAGFDTVKLKAVTVDIDSADAKRQMQVDQVWTSRTTVHPGDSLDIYTLLAGENGAETTRKVTYPVPVGAQPGTLYITVADALTTNVTEYRQLMTTPPKSPASLVRFLNELRPNTGAYVRIWRNDAVFQVQGEDLPDPPASLAMLLGRAQGGLAGSTTSRNAKVAEFAISAGPYAVSGSKTIQVEVKE